MIMTNKKSCSKYRQPGTCLLEGMEKRTDTDEKGSHLGTPS